MIKAGLARFIHFWSILYINYISYYSKQCTCSSLFHITNSTHLATFVIIIRTYTQQIAMSYEVIGASWHRCITLHYMCFSWWVTLVARTPANKISREGGGGEGSSATKQVLVFVQ